MQKVLESGRFGPISQAFTNEILNSFYIMIGRCLNFLDTLRVIKREIVNNMVKHILHDGGQGRQLGDRGFVGKALQPAHLDEHPIANQAILAEDVAKPADLVGITTVGG